MDGRDIYDVRIKLENTLNLNGQMQNQLIIIREKLEKLLSDVKDAYEANDVLLKEGVLRRRCRGFGIKGAYLKGGTFYLKGNMFFKDIKCRNCPNNPDYERRKMENEMFPMDLNLKSRHVWSTQDKQGVICGIKEQIIDRLSQSKRHGRKSKIDSEKLARLLNMTPEDFRIDWDYISSYNLQHRHSAKTCEAIWNLFLHPSLKRSAWSEKENHKLLEAAKKYNFQNWEAVAKEVGQRSDFQCFVQYQTNVCHMLPESYTKWSKEDDKRLLDVIARNTVNGIINWSNVNAYFPHKAKTTLHSRYNFTLNPDISRAQFTPEEDLLLIAAVKEYGNKFSCIPRSLFPNRSLIQLRSHYNNVLSKRHNYLPWSLEDDIKLMDFITKNGTKAWLECEKFFNERHSRFSCRTRFLTIKKYLDKNPGANIESLPRKHSRPYSSITINNWKEKVDELSINPKILKQKSKRKMNEEDLEKPKKVNLKKAKHQNEEDFGKKEQSTEVKMQPLNENKNQLEQNLPLVKKVAKIQPVKLKAAEKIVKPYIQRLRSNEINNYNFFKYAYNFEISRHPCDNLQIRDNDFAIVLSALNTQSSFNLDNIDFDLKIPYSIKQNIIESTSRLSDCNTLKLLPPSWSTAMGFRALCINTACLSTNLPPEQTPRNTKNEYIKKFRERLRFIFYSTSLLSRLDPAMVGIAKISNSLSTINATNRKRFLSTKDSNEYSNNKIKPTDLIENIKTEFET